MAHTSLRSIVLGLAVVLLAGAGQPSQKRKDPQSTYEPRSEPGAGQKYLQAFVGDWEVTKTFYPQTGDPVRVMGTCRQSMIHDGRFLQSEFVFEQNGKKTTGLGIVGFDPQTGRFITMWTDSRSTRVSLRQSEAPFDGKEIVLLGRSLEAEGKAPHSSTSRTVSFIEPGHNRIVHRQYVGRGDAKERLIMDLVMVRKGSGGNGS